MSLYTHTFTVALHDTDAAGVLFFGHLLRHAHDAYEAMMADRGVSLARILAEGEVHLPIVHCEADYGAPIRHGDVVEIEVEPRRVGDTSFTLLYQFRVDGRPAASALTVHVSIDPARNSKSPLPNDVKLIFINAD